MAGLREKLAAVMLRGVSSGFATSLTRNWLCHVCDHAEVIPKMAESCGISRSSVSREFISMMRLRRQASEGALRALCERRFDGVDLLIISQMRQSRYIDGVQFGGHHLIVSIGVDREGHKHPLGLADGATENAVVVKGLLQDLVERGVSSEKRRLFVIDGSKALRAGRRCGRVAIDAVFGTDNPVQRCRHHKIENVSGYLPKGLRQKIKLVMRAAYRLPEREGIAKLEEQVADAEKPPD